MVGNVYVKFDDEEDAQNAMMSLQGRFYAGGVAELNAQYFYSLIKEINLHRASAFY